MSLYLKRIDVTPQGYYYAKVNALECRSWGGYGVCDSCNEYFTDDGHLVFVLNSCLCGKCFDEWLDHAKVYEEDLQKQKEMSESWFKYHLGDLICMPNDYNMEKIKKLNEDTEKLLDRVSELDKEIDEGLRDIMPEAFKGVDDSVKED